MEHHARKIDIGHVLFVEDNEDDYLVMLDAMRRAGYFLNSVRVETREVFLELLRTQKWDAVVSDFRLPSFNALEVLEIINDANLNLPVVIVSGTVGEDVAVRLMKAGATDFILKDNSARLGPVLVREIADFASRRKQHEAEKALEDKKVELELMLNNIPAFIFYSDHDGHILKVNAEFSELFQIPAEDCIGKNFASITKGSPSDAERYARQTLHTGARLDTTEFMTFNDKKRWFYVSRIPYGGSAGKQELIAIGTDITELKESEQMLIAAKNTAENAISEMNIAIENANRMALEAEKASVLKDAFLRNLSHEIRTPLNGIIGYTEILANVEKINLDERDAYCKGVLSKAQELIAIFDALLFISEVAAQKFEFCPTDSNIRENVASVLESVSTYDGKKSLSFSYKVSDTIPAHVTVDSVRLRQVLFNLAKNAVLFTHEGSIHIDVDLLQTVPSTQKLLLQFSISDTGIGIAKEHFESIFEPFFQVDSSLTRKQGGLGIGLTIAKQIVERMGGEIHVVSKIGRGSTFIFSVWVTSC